MKIICAILTVAVTTISSVLAQTNPRAWYAQGQVWVVWTADTNNPPRTYAIYANATAFTNTADAELVGRLFEPEWNAGNVKSQMQAAFGSGAVPTGYRVPRPNGGAYTLAANEGLFVETARANGSKYYAVLPWGETNVAASQLTTNAVSYAFDVNDPPRPQIQARGPSTGTGHTVSIFVLFVDGDQDTNGGRLDFPIFGNHHKRGSPHLFLLVEPLGGLPGAGPWPATMCFHGSNGDAILWLPSNESPRSINVVPTNGYVVAFDDELYSSVNGQPVGSNTRWIGYVPSFDPFNDVPFNPTNDVDGSVDGDYSAYNPPADEIIVNYTQRRILWSLDWLIANANIDSDRVSLLGHSAGSMGAQSLTRAYPERISSLQLYNCGMRYFNSSVHAARQGDNIINLPVTLTNHLGQQPRLLDLLYFTNRIAAARDLPLTRHFHGKCDFNGAMFWGSDVVEQMRFCDREGWGMHSYWDLRKHGMNEWKDFWVDATTPATRANQTQRDDVRNQARYRAAQSYPAFFNLQLYANHGDPGPGYRGSTNAGADCVSTNYNGDDHGTWGGYFDWVPTNVVDTPTNWQCTLFLVNTNSGYAAVDASPFSMLTSDIAVRRPQQFLSAEGSLIRWEVRNAANGNLLADGTNTVGAEGLVTVTNVTVPRDPNRVRLSVSFVAPPPVVAPFITHTLRPSQTDLEIRTDRFNAPHVAVLSTNIAPAGTLLVHLPGTGQDPEGATNWLHTAASFGYHAIGLKYQNGPSMAELCASNPDLNCYPDITEETVTGNRYADSDTNALKQVLRADSIENRLQKLLSYLATNYPAENWQQFLDGAGGVIWSNVAVSGHSQGGSCALWIAKSREVERAILFATMDWVHTNYNAQPPWFSYPSVTPPERVYGFTHRRDGVITNFWQQPPIWEDLQLTQFAPIIFVESNAPPYLGSHTLTTLLPPGFTNNIGGLEYHDCPVTDRAGPTNAAGVKVWPLGVWPYLLTNVTVAPPPPPYSPVLYIAPTADPAALDVYWFASSNHSYYLEQSTNLWTWSVTGLPIRAPLADSWVTNTVAVSAPNLFFRLRCDPLTNSPVPTAPGIYSLAMSHDQLARTYRLNIPAAYNPATPTPLVFMLHGGGQTANEIAAMHPALAHHANTNGMILVFPQSTHNERQTGWSNADPQPGEPYVNDVGFIVSLIDQFDTVLNIDRTHVYTAGFSSGGIMSHYLASRTTNVFAAIAACGSSIGGERRMSGVLTTNPPPSGPIAALIINSTNDCTRPYYGGYNTDGNYQLPAIDAAYHYTNANVCAGAPIITTNAFMTQNIFRFEACDSKPAPGVLQPNQVIRHHWQTCAPNTEVVFITLTDGGHLWPDASDNVGFDANFAVIEFFKRH